MKKHTAADVTAAILIIGGFILVIGLTGGLDTDTITFGRAIPGMIAGIAALGVGVWMTNTVCTPYSEDEEDLYDDWEDADYEEFEDDEDDAHLGIPFLDKIVDWILARTDITGR